MPWPEPEQPRENNKEKRVRENRSAGKMFVPEERFLFFSPEPDFEGGKVIRAIPLPPAPTALLVSHPGRDMTNEVVPFALEW